MAIPKHMLRKYLDEELLFRRYYEQMGAGGSLQKLQNWYTKEHGVNPNNGKPFSREALSQAMWRWGLRNLDESKKVYTVYVSLFGFYLTDEKWKEFVQSKAKQCLKGAAKRFYREHPEYV